MKGSLEKAHGYQEDNMNLPVRELASALVFYIVAPDGLCYWFGERQGGDAK
jgi:hypothetical protein